MRFQLRRHLSSPLDCVRAIFQSRMTLRFSMICQNLGTIVESSSSHCHSNSFMGAYCFLHSRPLPPFASNLTMVSSLSFRSNS